MKNNELKTNNTVIKNIKDFLKMPPTIIVIFIIISLCFVIYFSKDKIQKTEIVYLNGNKMECFYINDKVLKCFIKK